MLTSVNNVLQCIDYNPNIKQFPSVEKELIPQPDKSMTVYKISLTCSTNNTMFTQIKRFLAIFINSISIHGKMLLTAVDSISVY